MIFAATTMLSLLAASAAATPLLTIRGFPPVGFGQELQNSDQANHWVAWVEGKSACPAAQVLNPLIDSPCSQSFTLNGYTYTFIDCDSNNNPQAVLYNGDVVLTCTGDSDKITCHGSQHDIVKHGYCK